LKKLAKNFPWETYLDALGIPDAREITVNDERYFAEIDALMQRTHKDQIATWKAYLTFHLAAAFAAELPVAFVNEAFSMRQKISGEKELPPRWKRCVRSTDNALGELLAQPYVAARFGGDSKVRAKALVTAIHDAMRTDLQLLPWMDGTTRASAIAKLDAMNDKVGYPATWRVYDFTVARDSYASNVMEAEKFELRRQLRKIGKPVDRKEWSMTPPTVNAYYDPSMNEIVLPAGELQPPFFSRDFYTPVNIGSEGANTIGHEITHGFDDEGSQFDGHGNLRDWWSNVTKAKFDAATQCVKDQYGAYEAVPGVKLNGALTAGENIADIGGVRLGYTALTAWKNGHPEEHRDVQGATDEQIFFLGYAQGWCDKSTPELLESRAHTNPHSPPRWRVNGPMAATPAFAKAYQCKEGAPLHPANACVVW